MIFSIKVRHRHVRAVEFVCPRCGLDRVGTVSTPIRWVHVGRYPLAPLGEHDRVVTCAECDHMCDVGALSVPTTAQLTRLLDDAWLAALTQALQATAGPVDDDTLERACGTLASNGFDSDPQRLDDALESLSPDETRRRLRQLAPEMTAFGKQGFLHRIAAVVGDEPTEAQRLALASIGHALGMATPHVNGVLAVSASLGEPADA